MIKSESIINISKALLVAQKNMSNPVKKSVNPFFKSKYSDLNSILEVCVDPLNEADIILLQPTITKENGKNFVQTLLIHVSGEFIGSECEIKVQKLNDAQAEGSGISYARRYGLQSLLSLSAVDDDGQKAVQEKDKKDEFKERAEKIEKERVALQQAEERKIAWEKEKVAKELAEAQEIEDKRQHYLFKVDTQLCVLGESGISSTAYYEYIKKNITDKKPNLLKDDEFNAIVSKHSPKPENRENLAKQSVNKFDKCNECKNETEFCICDIDKKAPVLAKV